MTNTRDTLNQELEQNKEWIRDRLRLFKLDEEQLMAIWEESILRVIEAALVEYEFNHTDDHLTAKNKLLLSLSNDKEGEGK